MNARAQALIVSDTLEQRRQKRPFLVTQRTAQPVLMLSGHPTDRLEDFAPLVRQKQGVASSVVRMIASFDEASSLELVDQGDQTTRQDTKRLAERLLSHSFRRVNDAEHTRMGRRQSKRCEPFGEPCGRVGADLGEKKGGGGAAAPSCVAHG